MGFDLGGDRLAVVDEGEVGIMAEDLGELKGGKEGFCMSANKRERGSVEEVEEDRGRRRTWVDEWTNR